MKTMLLRLLALVLAQFSLATVGSTTLTVATTVDGTGTSPLTLRAAIAEANNDTAAADFPYIINVPAGTYNLTLGELDIGKGFGSGVGSNFMIIGASTAQNTIIHQNGTDHVFVLSESTFALANLTIEGGNDTDKSSSDYGAGGGGISTGDGGAGGNKLMVTNCIFLNNTSEGYNIFGTPTYFGGAAISSAGGSVTLVGCTFTNNNLVGTNNVIFVGGAVLFLSMSRGDTLTAIGCAFDNNSIAGTANQPSIGGGLAAYNAGVGQGAYITNCMFQANSVAIGSVPGLGGGALFVTSNSATYVIGCTFLSNHISGTGAVGGAVWLGSYSSNVLQYCRFAGNSIAAGGGSGTDLALASGLQTEYYYTIDEDNWWGANSGPPAGAIVGTNTSSSAKGPFYWLVLSNTASASPIVIGQTNTLTASFLEDSAGFTIAAANLTAFTNASVVFSGIDGSISAAQLVFQASGTATATFTGTFAGMGSGLATVDGVTVSAPVQVFVSAAPTGVAIRSVNSASATINVAGVSGLTYHVLASDDMKTWTPIAAVLIPPGGSTNFIDGDVSQHTSRFYASVYP